MHAVTRRPIALSAAVAAVILIVAAFLVVKLRADDDRAGAVTIEGTGIRLEKPEGWKEMPEAERKRLPGSPLAVVRRVDGRGLVVLGAHRGRTEPLPELARELDRELRSEMRDFRKVSVRTVHVKAGEALLYSYVRPRKRTAHTLLVVPAGDRSYTLNTTVAAGADDAAREVGRILFAFDT